MALFDTIRAGASGTGDYEIKRSLRFNSADSANLSRTLSSDGNRRLWTWSGWLKLGKQPSGQRFIFSQRTSSSNQCNIQYSENGRFRFESGGGKGNAFTQGQFKDPSAWYHLIVTLDSDNTTANDRIIIYVNGERQGLDISPTISTGDHGINNNNAQVLGREADTNSLEYDGYMAEIHFIDGARKQPSDFAETDAVTGEYKPIKYTGTYGSQGWYYNFSDNSNTTASTLGKDYSGNGNNTTPSNISVSSGSGNDSLEDTPTNNFSTLNPIAGYETNFEESTNGNLDFSLSHGEFGFSTFEIPTSGKWYAEVVFTTHASGRCGITNLNKKNDTKWNGIDNLGGEIRVDDSVVQSGISNTIGNNKIVGIKVDRDAGTIAWEVDGSAAGSAVNISSMSDPNNLVFAVGRNSSGGSAPTGFVNFGQRPFSHLPTGYKALNSQNLPEPTIPKGDKYFDTALWTGNSNSNGDGNSQNITGFDFSPDWVWGKPRSTSHFHTWVDTVRGAGNLLFSNSTVVEETNVTAISAFLSNGFTVGDQGNALNNNGQTYVGWVWDTGSTTVTNTNGTISTSVRANTTAGISIATWTSDGQGSPTSLGHGLGVRPDFLIIKNRTGSSGNWQCWSPTFSNATNDFISLNLDDGKQTAGAAMWGTMNSTVVNFRHSANSSNGNTMVGFFFSNVEGFSKSGAYIGNGNSNGSFVFTGFRPAWIMVKRTSGSENWAVWDSVRDSGVNPNGFLLRPDSSTDEGGNVTAHQIDILSNGFKLRNSDTKGNGSGSTYVYLAFAENPFKYARAR